MWPSEVYSVYLALVVIPNEIAKLRKGRASIHKHRVFLSVVVAYEYFFAYAIPPFQTSSYENHLFLN